jgi:hypothetical protein
VSRAECELQLAGDARRLSGRQEITAAARSMLVSHAASGTTIEELAETLQVEHIA